MIGSRSTRFVSFLARVGQRAEKRGPRLSRLDVLRLEALFAAYDPLELRAGCARRGFVLGRRHTYVAGVKRAYLVHRPVAA